MTVCPENTDITVTWTKNLNLPLMHFQIKIQKTHVQKASLGYTQHEVKKKIAP